MLFPPTNEHPAGAAPPWVLLVEDDPQVARAQVRALHQAGYAVGHAATLAQLRALLPAQRWCSALIDIGLREGESGLDAAAFVRAALPALPVAFVTAESEYSVLANATAIAPVFAKHVPLADVLTAIGCRVAP